MQRECSEHSQSIPSIQNYVYMQSNLHKIKRSQDATTSRQCTMRPTRGLAYLHGEAKQEIGYPYELTRIKGGLFFVYIRQQGKDKHPE